MSKQRMKYQWFQEVPRNVTRREYERFQIRVFAATGFGLVATMMAFASLTGITMQSSRRLESIETMTMTEAAAHTENQDIVKLEGYLVADDPLVMPDDESRRVIRGRLTVSVRPTNRSTNINDDDDNSLSMEATLLDWAESAESVFLTDKETQIPLDFDRVHLPMQDEAAPLDPKIVRDGSSSRTSRPVAIEYGDRVFPLPVDEWGTVSSILTEVERQVLLDGQSVVIVAGLETSPDGNTLVDPLGDRLTILLGTEQSIQSQGQRMRLIFGLLWIPLALISWRIARSAQTLRQEFIRRSNQS